MKEVLLALRFFKTHLQEQHLCGVVHEQIGQYKFCRTLRSNVENPDLVQPQQCHTQSKKHAGVTQRHGRRPLQEESDPMP